MEEVVRTEEDAEDRYHNPEEAPECLREVVRLQKVVEHPAPSDQGQDVESQGDYL